LIGNRASAIGTAMLAGGAGAMVLEGPGPLGCLSALAAGVGIGLDSYTGFGSSMKKIYDRTVKHVKRFNRLDRRFFNTVMGLDRFDSLVGYCQLQGMYLACRDYAPQKLPNFYELKQQNTRNIVPNF
jgi:hypothetical protein